MFSNHSLIVTALAGLNLLLVATMAHGQDDQTNQLKDLQAKFDQRIVPVLQDKCAQCHSGDEANAGINVDTYNSIEQILNDDRKWQRIVNEIKTGSMPPEDEAPLSAAEKNDIETWSEAVFKLIDCGSVNPGNVTIRKLTRYEYRNSVRDLLGINYKPADSFPGDDVGHGFDNIADVLSLPPILFEKYLDAAEEITQEAIFDPEKLAMDLDLAAVNFEVDTSSSNINDGEVALFSKGMVKKSFNFPKRGAYALAVMAYGDQAGKDFVKMSCRLDGRLIKTVEVKAGRRRPERYVFRLPIFEPGKKLLSLSFDNDYYIPRAVGSQDRNLHVQSVVIKGPKRKPPQKHYLKFTTTDRSAAVRFIGELLPRAFRSPVTAEQQDRFIGLYDAGRKEGLSFHGSLQQVAQAILISPRFLYRFEEPVAKGAIRSLNDYERATGLSYFLWSSTPDDQLLKLARSSSLASDEVWRQQIMRMLKDVRASALIENFAEQWLNLKVLADVQPDPELFPGVDAELLSDMAKETRLVLADIFMRDGSVLELLDSKFTYVNQSLAKHYQMKADTPEDDRFVKVTLDGQRSGILTHASILTLTSNPDRTSPVKRGKWLLENFLGEEPPPAVDSITPLDDQKQLVGSLRQRMQQHREDPACASCHTKMDALGFSLENFDAVGRFRLKDDGFDIDSTSEMPDGTELKGAAGLQAQLKTTYRKQFVRCFTEKLLTYALGRGLKYYDRCTVNEIIAQAASNDYRISEIVYAIANSETFLKRSGKETLFTGAKQ